MSGETIGVIGLGTMGGRMAEHVFAAGLPLVVCDTNPEVMARFAAMGAQLAHSPRELADRANVILACLPSVEVSLDVAFGPNGISGGKAVEIYLECSTIGPDAIIEIDRALGAKDIMVVDCPISGGAMGASAGSLTAIVAGPDAALERARPVLESFSRNIFHVAKTPGPAQIAKLVNNMLSSAGTMAAFEGMVMGVKAGLDPEMLIDIINVSTGRNAATLDKFPSAILPRTFGGRVSTGIKDLELFLKEAERQGAPVWIAPRVRELYLEAAANGFGKESLRIIQYMEKLAGGVEVKKRSLAGPEADKKSSQ